jgi:hypothetical protein
MEAEATGQKTLEHWGVFGNFNNKVVAPKPTPLDNKMRINAQDCRGNRSTVS